MPWPGDWSLPARRLGRPERLLGWPPVAKKTRTPAPPKRPVQAPQRRDTSGRTPEQRRRLAWIFLVAFAASGLIGLGVVVGFIFTSGGGGNSTNSKSKTSSGLLDGPKINSASLPGVMRKPAPWPVEYEHLPDRLSALHLHALPQEALALHIHQHLDIFVNGKHVTVPALIGIYGGGNPSAGGFFLELHTHDPSGIIHVESPTQTKFSLGQFMGDWGVYFTPRCLGSYCATPTKPLRVYVDGKQVVGDFTRLALKKHQVIAIVYGKPPKKIPSTYNFGGL